MSSMTKAQLVDELAKLRHNYELLEQKCIAIANDMSAMSVQRDVAESKLEDAEREATRVAEHCERLLLNHGFVKRYIAVCGKDIESPAYVSDSFATEQEAWDDARATGYPLTDVDEVWSAKHEAATKTERVRHGHALIRRKVFEFDPSIPGDFKRASEQARAQGGITRRIDSRNH